MTRLGKKRQWSKIILFIHNRVRHIFTIIYPLFEKSPSYLEVDEFKRVFTLLMILKDKTRYLMTARFAQPVDRRRHSNYNWDNIDNPILMREIVDELIDLTNVILKSPDPEVQLGKDKLSHRLFVKSINKELKKLKTSLEGYTWPDELEGEIL